MSHRFICGCIATAHPGLDGWRITQVWSESAKCHRLGDEVSAAEMNYARYVDSEWDRAERDHLEQR